MRRDIDKLTGTTFDVVIIGGGIYGVCIAWEAALRGFSVALLEQYDFGHATSANSQKIIHGGLRYLQHGDIKRMRESIRERTNLMRIAPHLVHPFPCIMPTYGHLLKGPEVMAIALLLNDLISFDRNTIGDPQKHLPRGRVISREECLELLPGIDQQGLTGGALWYDCQMYNSERLTLAFVRSAAERGATPANYVKVTGFLRGQERILGVKAVDQLTGKEIQVRGKITVNAAGPWVDELLGLIDGARQTSQFGVRLAKAVNIATRRLFDYGAGLSGGRGVPGPDGADNRLFFVTPWRDQSLVGTTYTPYEGPPGELRVTAEEVKVLLNKINSIYPEAQLKMEDVRFVYSGLVPASDVDEETGTATRARHYQIRDHGEDGVIGLISVLGVKYTTARDVAEKVVDRVFQAMDKVPVPSCSATQPLYGGKIGHFEAFLYAEIDKRPCDLDEMALRPLIYNYGNAYPELLNYYDPVQLNRRSTEEALLRAQIIYAVEHEMACTLNDVIFRRTEIGTGGYPGRDVIEFCAHVMGRQLGWDSFREKEEIDSVVGQFEPWLRRMEKQS